MGLDFTGAKLSVVSVRGAGDCIYVEVRNTGDLPAVIGRVTVKLQGRPGYLSWFVPPDWVPVMPDRTALVATNDLVPLVA